MLIRLPALPLISRLQAASLTVVLASISHGLLAETMVFADFNGDSYAPWQVEGSAFGSAPANGTLPNQMAVTGFEGAGLVNSFNGGDNATGRLISPEFTISKDFITFLIGGGGWPGQTCMNLIVDGAIVRTMTGGNTQSGGSEELLPAYWEAADLVGRTAHLEIVDSRTGGWGHINVDFIAFADERPTEVTHGPASRAIVAEEKWLNLPVSNSAQATTVTLTVDGVAVRSFSIGLASGTPDWWASVDISEWKGKTILVGVNRIRSDSTALQNVHQSSQRPGEGSFYSEALRPQFHFSALRGWLNDPNGLVFFNGEYHLFFQHNPYGTEWGNMHWGHAVSTDLVHWREVGEALYPDKLGTMYSGSAVVDWENTSGFGDGLTPPMVLAYTAAGSPFTQCIAYSSDGRTFTKSVANPALTGVSDERDPRIFWHEPSGKWVMLLWEVVNGHHATTIYNSANLEDWTRVGAKLGDPVGSGAYLYECPDLFELPIEGNPGQTRWILMAADSGYGIGSFDGQTFTSQIDRLRAAQGGVFYAAQTFSDEPSGRRIQIGWLRAPAPGMPFNQCMSLPHELKLAVTADGMRLVRQPVVELESLRRVTHEIGEMSLASGATNPFAGKGAELVELRADFDPGSASSVLFNVRGVLVIYNRATQRISVNGTSYPAPLQNGRMRLAIFLDRTSMEVFASDGLTYAPAAVTPNPANKSISVSVSGGTANFSKLTLHELGSAWEPASPEPTPTPTPEPSPTPEPTPTPSPETTPTPEPTPTPTPQPTPTSEPTATPNPSVTPAAGSPTKFAPRVTLAATLRKLILRGALEDPDGIQRVSATIDGDRATLRGLRRWRIVVRPPTPVRQVRLEVIDGRSDRSVKVYRIGANRIPGKFRRAWRELK